MRSIRQRLIFILAGLFVLAWLIAFAATYATTAHGIDSLLDAQLAQDARVLLALSETSSPTANESAISPVSEVAKYRKVLAFMIWRDGNVLLRSDHAPAIALPLEDGYQSLFIADRNWRGYTTRSADHDTVVWVGERFAVRQAFIDELARDMLFPLAIALPILVFAVAWGVNRGFRPLARVAREVTNRSPLNLQPLALDHVPSEIETMVAQLNTLLERLREAFDRERRFTADAAHELRTPLAGIKTHAQIALRQDDKAQRRRAIHEVIQGVDRSAHLVQQLLTLARLDRERLEVAFERVDLKALAADIIAELDPVATGRCIGVSLHGSSETISGDAIALRVLIRNLIDNAIRYTPSRGAVSVTVMQDAEEVRVTVADTGPGISPTIRDKVFDRFYRAAQDGYGCGLGLSIVQRAVELHQARLVLEDAQPTGLHVTVAFRANAASIRSPEMDIVN